MLEKGFSEGVSEVMLAMMSVPASCSVKKMGCMLAEELAFLLSS